jgi:serine/threonine-protein kinase
LWRSTKTVERPLVRLTVDLGSQVALPSLGDWGGNLILSPDGKRLVFVSGNPRRLYTQRLDQSKPSELTGTEGASVPFFSPDGQWVGFFTGVYANKLNKISVEGGAVSTLANVGASAGGSWGADGNIIVGGQFIQGLLRVPASGGAPSKVLDLAPGELLYASPQILPGGKAVLFVDLRTSDAHSASIEALSLTDGRRKTLVRGGTFARYLPSGHLVYINNGTLFAIRFDLNLMETLGTPVSILDGIASMPQYGAADLDVAANGTLVYRGGDGKGGALGTIQWVDGAGKREPLLSTLREYANLHVSPDGKRVSFVVSDGASQDVWVYDIQRDTMTRLTFGREPYVGSVWSPDGRFILFSAIGKGIYFTRADGAGQPQPLTQSKNFQAPFSISRDGKRLAYIESIGNPQIWTLPLEEHDGQLQAGKAEQFLKSQSAEFFYPMFSPDGHWLAYASNESGIYEIYVRAFPAPASGQGGQWQISNGGARLPIWSQAEHELLYHAGQGNDQLMTVNYSVNGDSFVPEKPRVRFEKLPGWDIDLAPDGKRVAVIAPQDTADAATDEHEVTFLFNFFDELRRRVPAAGAR